MDVHFCQGHIKRASIIGKAKTCEEVNACRQACGKKIQSCASDKGCSTNGDHKGCCHNESFSFDMDFDSLQIISATSDTQDWSIALNSSSLGSLLVLNNLYTYQQYIPPPLEKSITILFQVFRL